MYVCTSFVGQQSHLLTLVFIIADSHVRSLLLLRTDNVGGTHLLHQELTDKKRLRTYTMTQMSRTSDSEKSELCTIYGEIRNKFVCASLNC
jgi:hypothetical protein